VRLTDGGDVIVLQARGKGLTHDGRRYDNDYAFVIHFREGKIARYEEYCDTDLIARVLPDRVAAKSMPKPTPPGSSSMSAAVHCRAESAPPPRRSE